MHYEDLQQSSLIQGAWLLKTASTQPLHKSYSAAIGNQLWWAAELRANGEELEEGSFSAGDTLPTNPQPCSLVFGCQMAHK